MYRSVNFKSEYPDEWGFDAQKNPIAPGSRELADKIFEILSKQVTATTPIRQHSFYGWAFGARFNDSTFYNVLNPAGGECYLTISSDRYWIRTLLLKRPKKCFENYCELVNEVLQQVPKVSEIVWQDYKM